MIFQRYAFPLVAFAALLAAPQQVRATARTTDISHSTNLPPVLDGPIPTPEHHLKRRGSSSGGKSISQDLPSDAEPSGAIWAHGRLYIVDDGGTLFAMDQDGNVEETYDLDGADAESVTWIPSRPNFVYVGVESDSDNDDLPVIIEVNVHTKDLVRKFNILDNFPASEKHGMESLAFVADNSRPNGGVFLCGSQDTATVYVYDLDIKHSGSTRVKAVGKFQAPGSDSDLADMTVMDGKIYFLYDNDQMVTSVSTSVIGHGSSKMNPSPEAEATYHTDGSDYEGLAFNDKYAFIAVDSGDVLRFPRSAFLADDDDDDDDESSERRENYLRKSLKNKKIRDEKKLKARENGGKGKHHHYD